MVVHRWVVRLDQVEVHKVQVLLVVVHMVLGSVAVEAHSQQVEDDRMQEALHRKDLEAVHHKHQEEVVHKLQELQVAVRRKDQEVVHKALGLVEVHKGLVAQIVLVELDHNQHLEVEHILLVVVDHKQEEVVHKVQELHKEDKPVVLLVQVDRVNLVVLDMQVVCHRLVEVLHKLVGQHEEVVPANEAPVPVPVVDSSQAVLWVELAVPEEAEKLEVLASAAILVASSKLTPELPHCSSRSLMRIRKPAMVAVL